MTEYEGLICTKAVGYYQVGDRAKVVDLDPWGNPIFEKQQNPGVGLANWTMYFRKGEQYTPPEPKKIQIETIKAGTLLTISTGEYSDYNVHGVFRVMKDITQDDYDAFRVEDENGFCDVANVLARMATSGYIEDVPSTELHLGSYGELDPKIYHED